MNIIAQISIFFAVVFLVFLSISWINEKVKENKKIKFK